MGFDTVTGERLRITLTEPVTTDRLTLLQTVTAPRQQMFDARLRFDGGEPVDVDLDETSLAEPGQVVTFPTRTFQEVEIEVGATSAPFDVGLAEVRIPGVAAEELLRLPTDLPTAVGTDSLDHRYVVLLTRERTDARNEFRRDEELTMRRIVAVPAARSFGFGATMRLDADAPDEVLDRALGFRTAEEGGLSLAASGRMPGNPRARARATVDGDPGTAWRSPLDPVQPWVAVRAPSATTIDQLELQVVADGRHSVPTELTLSTPDGQTRQVALPPIADGSTELATTTVTVPVTPALVTDQVQVTVSGLRPLLREPRGEERAAVLPVAIAELGLPGVLSEPGAVAAAGCVRARRRSGSTTRTSASRRPARRVTPSTAWPSKAGRATRRLAVRRQAPDDWAPTAGAPTTGTVDLSTGDHVVRTADASTSGFSVDQLVLGSDRGGAALPLGPRGQVPPPERAGHAARRSSSRTRTPTTSGSGSTGPPSRSSSCSARA